jgi:hypothetical protein
MFVLIYPALCPWGLMANKRIREVTSPRSIPGRTCGPEMRVGAIHTLYIAENVVIICFKAIDRTREHISYSKKKQVGAPTVPSAVI